MKWIHAFGLPDLLILDLHLPDENGLEILRHINRYFDRLHTRILCLTSELENDRCLQAFEAGVNDFIRQPVHMKELACRIKVHLFQIVKEKNYLQLSFDDQLTKIANRRTLHIELNEQWRNAKRNRQSISCLMIDIDNFKNYNVKHGHTQGDEILVEVAQAVKVHGTRATDIVARYGGEEFCMLLPKCSIDGANKIAQAICKYVELKINTITVSIGVVTIKPEQFHQPGIELSGASLIKRADVALYEAKHNGRNQVAIYAE
jgi:diguanylate cyclase (GGDEF)-like protein